MREGRNVSAAIRGFTVLIAGPDGSGKSTLSQAIAERLQRGGVATHVAHWSPGIVVARTKGGAPPRVVTNPHGQAARGRVLSAGKLLLTWLDFALGAATSWRRARRRGVLIVERGWYDQIVDRKRYRLASALDRGVCFAGRFLPRPDLLVLTTGEPAEMVRRKPELTELEVERQLDAWDALAAQAARRHILVNTTAVSPGALADEVIRELGQAKRSL